MNYFELEAENNIFKTISVQTTYKCQMQCSNCYLGDMLNNPKYLDINIYKFKQALLKLPYRTDIRFIGAEPTLNPELFSLIKTVRACGHRPSLLTNGLKLQNENYVSNLKKSGLNMLGLSMNGALDNNLYELFDGGKYAKPKKIALYNCFKYNILPHINVIIDPTNAHVISDLIEYIVNCALSHKKRLSLITFPVMLRLKSIGKMGYYRDSHTYSLEELLDIMAQYHDIDSETIIDGCKEKRSIKYSFDTKAGKMWCKLTDWSLDDEGVPDSNSKRRGILTENYKLAPFFEYYVRKQSP